MGQPKQLKQPSRASRGVAWLALSLSLGYLALMSTMMWMFEHAITLNDFSEAIENPGRIKSWTVIGLTAVVIFLLSQSVLRRLSRAAPVSSESLTDASVATPGTVTEQNRRSWFNAALLLVLIALILAGTGSYVVQEQEAALDNARFRQFSIIGKSKAGVAARWIDERRRNVRVLLENSDFVVDLERWTREGARSPALRETLTADLAAVVQANGFDGLTVVTTDGQDSLSVPDNLAARNTCREVAQSEVGSASDEIRLSHAFFGTDDTPKLDVIGNVFATGRAGQRHFATLCLRIDLTQRLLPSISRWPGMTRSGEVLLGRIDGDDVVLLHGPGAASVGERGGRIRNGAALWQSAIQTSQMRGTQEIKDEHGIAKVLTAHPITDTPWVVMVRMNRDDADQLQMRNQTYATILIGFALLFVVAVFAIAWARTSSAREGVQMHRDQLLDELHTLAYYDELTGLPGRRLITDRLEVALRDAERRNESLGLMFLDLDQFKAINDVHGHAAGDFVLKTIADRLRAALRRNDSAGRMGGDEYLIVLPGNLDATTTHLIRDKIVCSIEQPIVWNGITLQVGASIGVAMYPVDGTQLQDLMETADAAMYADKQTRQ